MGRRDIDVGGIHIDAKRLAGFPGIGRVRNKGKVRTHGRAIDTAGHGGVEIVVERPPVEKPNAGVREDDLLLRGFGDFSRSGIKGALSVAPCAVVES